jgi:hypothetical protein
MRKSLFADGLHNIFGIAGVMGLIFTIASFSQHLWSEIDGVVQSKQVVCEQPLNNRCTEVYVIRTPDGSSRSLELSGYGFRSEEFEVGKQIRKEKFELAYVVDGKRVDWRYAAGHLTAGLLSVLILAWWGFLTRNLLQSPSIPKQ